ncbi:MAG: PQQ-binding-like beta-propeller repeat protein [bacterium]
MAIFRFFIQRSGWRAATRLVMLGGLLISGCVGIRLTRVLIARPIDWTTYGGSGARMNLSSTSLTPPLKVIWEYGAVGGLRATPLVRDSIMMIGTLKGDIQAVHIGKKERVGSITVEAAVIGTPAWEHPRLYVPSANGKETMACYDLESSMKRWSAQVGHLESSPLLLNDVLFVTSLNGSLYCLRKLDGREIWRFDTAEKEQRKPIHSSVASDGEILVFGCDDGGIYAVNALSGTLRWKYHAEASVVATPVIVQGKAIVGSFDGTIVALDLQSGRLVWKFSAKAKVYAPAASNGQTVFCGASDGMVYALDVASGSLVWKFSAHSIVNAAPLVAGDFLYVTSLDRTVHALQVQDGKERWNYVASGRIKVSPVIWGDMLFLSVEDNQVVILKSEGR